MSEPVLTEQSKDDSDIKTLIRNITVKCKEEMENNCLHKPLEDYLDRVAHYTGLSKTDISQAISDDFTEINYKDKYFELNDLKLIFLYIAELYINKQNPTYRKLFTWYQTMNTTITFSQFQYMMSCLRFEYHKDELGKEILVEDPSLTFERYLYLKQINNFRSKCAPIYYIDERFFDSTYSFPKPWIKDVDISSQACNGYVFFHAVSKQGFLNGLFCSPTTKTDFVKWISHILIPQLQGPSIIVMDNNSLHGSVIDSITPFNSKQDMLKYLRLRNIPCSENLHKAELYNLINKCSVKHTNYDVDDIFKAHGHQVLRLPDSFHDLSLTYFLWKYFIESNYDTLVNVELTHIKTVLLERLSSLPKKLWDRFDDELLAMEEHILNIDCKASNALEAKYKIS